MKVSTCHSHVLIVNGSEITTARDGMELVEEILSSNGFAFFENFKNRVFPRLEREWVEDRKSETTVVTDSDR